MPSERFWSPRKPSIPSTSPPPNDSTPESGSISRGAPEPPAALARTYPNGFNDDTGRPGWDAALAVASILEDIPALPLALAGPLTQVLDVISGTIRLVKTMHEVKDGCARLIYRVLKFLQNLVDELRTIQVPIPDDTPTAARLFALKSDLMAIRDDVNQWSHLNLLDRYLKRDEIKVALSRHGENLTDCLNTFHLLASVRASSLADRVETIVFPGPSVLVTQRGDREGPLVPPSIPSASLHDLLQSPAGQAIFEQIGVIVQERLEEMGLWATSTPLGSSSPPATVLQTGHGRHVSYLTSQISELTAELSSILPDLAIPTDIEARFMGRGVHRPQIGDPTTQLRETVSATLQLLNDLHNTPHVKLDAAGLADTMTKLSLNLSDLGLRDEAFEVQTTAVVLHRAGRDMPGLAASLSHFSNALWHLGRREKGLQTMEEAVNLYRPLVADRPDVFRPDLADSLVTFSVYLSEIGRREEAIQASEEALSIYRPLAADRPGVFCPDLARSLVTLSNRLSEFGRHEEALKTNEEAVSIYRPLVADRPDVFRPDLARSLVNFSKRLSEFGRHEEALKVSEEATIIYRRLAADRPEAFRPRLATSLVNLSQRLREFGCHEDALKASLEAVSIYRPLVADRPDVFREHLARSLVNLAIDLSEFSRHKEALKATEEAVSIYRPLATDRPSVFHPDLARSLTILSTILSGLGCMSEALLAIREAAGLLRSLARDRPTVFSRQLAASLSALSRRYSDMGRHVDALQARREAEEL